MYDAGYGAGLATASATSANAIQYGSLADFERSSNAGDVFVSVVSNAGNDGLIAKSLVISSPSSGVVAPLVAEQLDALGLLGEQLGRLLYGDSRREHPQASSLAEVAEHGAEDQSALATVLRGMMRGSGATSAAATTLGGVAKADLAVAAATDILHKAVNPKAICPLHSYMASLLDDYRTPENVRAVLQALSSAGSRVWIRRVRAGEVSHEHKDGTSAPPERFADGSGLHVLNFDNIGWKKRGKDCGYVQFVLVLWQRVNVGVLSDMGLLGEGAASRLRKKFFEANASPEAYLPSRLQLDFARSFSLSGAQSALQAVVDNPQLRVLSSASADDLAFGRVSALADVVVSTEIPKSGRRLATFTTADDGMSCSAFASVELDETAEETVARLSNDGHDVTEESLGDRYTMNGVHSTSAVKMDLNSSEAVLAMLDLALAREPKHSDADLAALHKHLGVFLCSDGAPHAQANHLKDGDSAGKYSSVRCFGGGFHLVLKSLNMLGRLFESVFLREWLMSTWRKSAGKAEWFLAPGDPTQTLTETGQLLFGLYIQAVAETAEEMAKGAGPDATITASDVEKQMLMRAKEEPLVAAVMLYIRLAECVLIALESETEADFELYRVSHSILRLLFANTNAFGYVRTGMDSAAEWNAASHAEMLYYSKVLLTRLTQHGKRIFGDRFASLFSSLSDTTLGAIPSRLVAPSTLCRIVLSSVAGPSFLH